MKITTTNPQFSVSMVCRSDTAGARWVITDEELHPSVLEINVEKRLGEAAGTFVLTLAPRRLSRMPGTRIDPAVGGATTWHDSIQPMDYVEIKLWAPPREPRVVMRGFVDTVAERVSWEGGRPIRQLLVAGRDWGRTLLDAKLWWIDAAVEGMTLIERWRLARARLMEWGGPTAAEPTVPEPEQASAATTMFTPTDVIRTIWEAFITPRIDDLLGYFPMNEAVGRLTLAVEVDEESDDLRAFDPIYYFTKLSPMMDLWLAMQVYVHSPWRELFIDDAPDGPRLVYRPNPWLDAKGDWIQEPTASVETHKLDDTAIIARSLARSDQGLINYFTTLPEGWSQIAAMAETSPGLVEGLLSSQTEYIGIQGDAERPFPGYRVVPDDQRFKGNPYILDTEEFNYHLFGLRTAKFATPYFDIERPASDDGKTTERIGALMMQGRRLNVQLARALGHAPWLEAGDFQLPGDERIRVGHYLSVTMAREPAPARYYVVGVTHRFRQPLGRGDGSFRTSVAVTRGRGYLARTGRRG